jgi:hypothetical protein
MAVFAGLLVGKLLRPIKGRGQVSSDRDGTAIHFHEIDSDMPTTFILPQSGLRVCVVDTLEPKQAFSFWSEEFPVGRVRALG